MGWGAGPAASALPRKGPQMTGPDGKEVCHPCLPSSCPGAFEGQPGVAMLRAGRLDLVPLCSAHPGSPAKTGVDLFSPQGRRA